MKRIRCHGASTSEENAHPMFEKEGPKPSVHSLSDLNLRLPWMRWMPLRVSYTCLGISIRPFVCKTACPFVGNWPLCIYLFSYFFFVFCYHLPLSPLMLVSRSFLCIFICSVLKKNHQNIPIWNLPPSSNHRHYDRCALTHNLLHSWKFVCAIY